MPIRESDDDMSSTGITEKELFSTENEVMPETTRRSMKYGMNKTVDWFTDKKIYLACGQFTLYRAPIIIINNILIILVYFDL